VIIGFQHEGLATFYRTGSTRDIQAAHASKLSRILGLLDVAAGPEDLNLPAFKPHPLRGDLKGHGSMRVAW